VIADSHDTTAGCVPLCIAHVTNTMATGGDDFEKGHDNGALAAIRMTGAIAQVVKARLQAP